MKRILMAVLLLVVLSGVAQAAADNRQSMTTPAQFYGEGTGIQDQGCEGSDPQPIRAVNPLLEANHQAAEQLLAAIPPSHALSKDKPIIVTTIVSVDDLAGSRFGRMLAEQIGTQMSNNGYRLIELKLRDKIFVKQGVGELMLSREVKDLSLSQRAQAVVVGTYAESTGGFYPGSPGSVFVTLKLVGVADNVVIAAHDYVLPLDGNLRSLLYPVR